MSRTSILFKMKDILVIINEWEWTTGTKAEIERRLELVNKELEKISLTQYLNSENYQEARKREREASRKEDNSFLSPERR